MRVYLFNSEKIFLILKYYDLVYRYIHIYIFRNKFFAVFSNVY